jgi:prepilin-type N-terminal cleavage/methylation domain-containing protein
MGNDALVLERPDRGFSIVEMVMVVAIVGILAAVSFPAIANYTRNYRIRGAAQEVAGELQAARSKAIMTNTDNGVSFVVVDRDSYRFVQEDVTYPDGLSGIRNLPVGIQFVVSSTLVNRGPTLRFLRLGGFCNPAATGSCAAAVPTANRTRASESTLVDSSTANGLYIGAESATSVQEIRLRETGSGLERVVRIAPGGRVLPQP